MSSSGTRCGRGGACTTDVRRTCTYQRCTAGVPPRWPPFTIVYTDWHSSTAGHWPTDWPELWSITHGLDQSSTVWSLFAKVHGVQQVAYRSTAGMTHGGTAVSVPRDDPRRDSSVGTGWPTAGSAGAEVQRYLGSVWGCGVGAVGWHKIQWYPSLLRLGWAGSGQTTPTVDQPTKPKRNKPYQTVYEGQGCRWCTAGVLSVVDVPRRCTEGQCTEAGAPRCTEGQCTEVYGRWTTEYSVRREYGRWSTEYSVRRCTVGVRRYCTAVVRCRLRLVLFTLLLFVGRSPVGVCGRDVAHPGLTGQGITTSHGHKQPLRHGLRCCRTSPGGPATVPAPWSVVDGHRPRLRLSLSPN